MPTVLPASSLAPPPPHGRRVLRWLVALLLLPIAAHLPLALAAPPDPTSPAVAECARQVLAEAQLVEHRVPAALLHLSRGTKRHTASLCQPSRDPGRRWTSRLEPLLPLTIDANESTDRSAELSRALPRADRSPGADGRNLPVALAGDERLLGRSLDVSLAP